MYWTRGLPRGWPSSTRLSWNIQSTGFLSFCVISSDVVNRNRIVHTEQTLSEMALSFENHHDGMGRYNLRYLIMFYDD